jgi:hypothetical protein
MRDKSECYIIYDLAAFQRDLKARRIETKVYTATNGVLNTKAVIEADYAVKVVHRRTGNIIWYNDRLVKTETKVPAADLKPRYKRPTLKAMMTMSQADLDEYNAQFPEY